MCEVCLMFMNDTEALDHLSIQQLLKLQTGKNNDKIINIGPLKTQTNKQKQTNICEGGSIHFLSPDKNHTCC